MRIVIIGCGTGVGKTRCSVALIRELVARGFTVAGMKPIESGMAADANGRAASDASALANAGSFRDYDWLPLFNFAAPVSPHLAARAAGVEISLHAAREWVLRNERRMALAVSSHSVSVVETAGGVFSPLSPDATNFNLALALEPATWILVAADALGVLHDVSATVQAMGARGRLPDHIVLSAAREADASTGSNAAELTALGICQVSAVLARNDDCGITALADALFCQ